MALPQYEGSTGYVRALDDHVVGGADTVKLAMDRFGDEYKSWFNTTFLDALKAATIDNSGGDNIGVTPILTGADTVQKALAALLIQVQAGTLGQIPDGTITDVKLSGVAGQIKDTVTAHLADYVRNPAFGQTTGSANTYVFASTPALPALVDGVSAYLDINVANTGASTLDWDSKGAKAIVDGKGVAVIAGKLPLNGIVGVRYNLSTTSFQLLGEGGDEIVHSSQEYTTPGTYSFIGPDNVTQVTAIINGAGGGGGGGYEYYGGGGGGGGGYIDSFATTPGEAISVVVGVGGTGGAGGAGGTGGGTAGGTSSFSSFSGTGGAGGYRGTVSVDGAGGAGGTGGGYGAAGGAGGTGAGGTGGVGANSTGTGGAGGTGASGTGGAGGAGRVLIIW